MFKFSNTTRSFASSSSIHAYVYKSRRICRWRNPTKNYDDVDFDVVTASSNSLENIESFRTYTFRFSFIHKNWH